MIAGLYRWNPRGEYCRGKGNTEGRPKMEENLRAYIAGFLDGDGSIHFQLIPRPENVYGYEIRVSVCFYQHTAQRRILEWLKERIGLGYIRDRGDGVSDYVIVGYAEVRQVLELVAPYVVLKKPHVERAMQMLGKLRKRFRPPPDEFIDLAKQVDEFATLNYSKKKQHDARRVRALLEKKGFLAPVTTAIMQK